MASEPLVTVAGAAGDAPPRSGALGTPALILGILAWLAVIFACWPSALSFEDDVGYVGEAKLLVAGHVLPQPADVGVWVPNPRGPFPKFPLFVSVLLAPLVALTPKLAFLLGVGSAVGICVVFSRVLKEWGTDPVWALLALAHPTVTILARTVTADLPLSLFALAAWWAIRRRRRIVGALCLAALLPTKATGFLLALALIGGELIRLLPALRRGDRAALKNVGSLAAGLALGGAVLIALNELSAGGPGFAYDLSFLREPPFWYTHFPQTAPAHLRTYLLLPPLLFLGIVPFWRRREWGPILLMAGLGSMMCFYFFVDSGANRLESLILAPRLVMPVVCFLLLGYADLVGGEGRRRRVRPALPAIGLLVLTLGVALPVNLKHHRWQASMAQALAAATRAAADLNVAELGVTPEAIKVGVMFAGRTRVVDPSGDDARVILCSTGSLSHRQPRGRRSCSFPDYTRYFEAGDYQVLVRTEPSARRGG